MKSAEAGSVSGGLLLIPVSGGSGSGELQRARLLARSVRSAWPELPISIAAESGALALVPEDDIAKWPLPASPTRCNAEVIEAINSQRPAVVIFDSTARTAQLRAARALGAQVIYLSSRASARRRGFRLSVLALLDQHWSVEFDPGRRIPSLWQRLLLRLRPGLRWRSLSVLHEAPTASELPPLLQQMEAQPFILMCPGGNGGRLGSSGASEAFAGAAGLLSNVHLLPVLLVRSDWPAGRVEVQGSLLSCGPLANAGLMSLLQSARVAVVGAGSLVLQALSVGTATIALPLARDQPRRLAQLLRAHAVASCESSIEALIGTTQTLWQDPEFRATLIRNAARLQLRSGLDQAVDALGPLLNR
jgi:hypothetical protein